MKATIKELEVNKYGGSAILRNVRLAFVSIAKPNTKYGEKNEDKEVVSGYYEATGLVNKDNTEFVDQYRKLIEKTLKLNENKKISAADKKKILAGCLKIGKDTSNIKDGDGSAYKRKDKDGNPTNEAYEGFSDHWAIRAKTKAVKDGDGFKAKKPLILRTVSNESIEGGDVATELYAGVYANVMVSFSPYKSPLGVGMTVYLNGIQKLKNGERLGGYNPFDDLSDEFADEFEDEAEIDENSFH